MNLLHHYDMLSARNKLSVLGIDLIHESAAQWEMLEADHFNGQLTRLMAWINNEEWNPILDHGTLFMGVVNTPGISKVVYRLKGRFISRAVLSHGYWRPLGLPVPLDAIKGTLEVLVETTFNNIEIAWLIVPDTDHQRQFAEMKLDEILPANKI